MNGRYEVEDFRRQALELARNAGSNVDASNWESVASLHFAVPCGKAYFALFDLARIPVKQTDPRSKRFLNQFGDMVADATMMLARLYADEKSTQKTAGVSKMNCLDKEQDSDRPGKVAIARAADMDPVAAVRGAA